MSRLRLDASTDGLPRPRQRFNPRVAVKKAESWPAETILLTAAVATVVFAFMWFA
jgi:hypothetical protein